MSTESFAKELQSGATDIISELGKQLIAVSAAMLIFSVALSNLMAANQNHMGLMKWSWLSYLLSILAGVVHQLTMAERMRSDAGHILDGQAQIMYRAQDGRGYAVSPPWRSEKVFRYIQTIAFLIGVGLTGISLLFS